MMIMNKEQMDILTKKRLRDYLSGFITDRRSALFNAVIRNRTRYICMVLEDIYQPHNASAVLRSCDCFGIQDVHIIENKNLYEVNPDVALGAAQWLTLRRYNSFQDNTLQCLSGLKEKGYRLVATTPHHNATALNEFDLKAGKIALLFGTEKDGLTEHALALSDEKVRIPMQGFTESFNISVSAALFLFHFTSVLRKLDTVWQLNEDEKVDVQLEWLRTTIKGSQEIEKLFHSKNN
jgi:tRNA (guanosine-2'-O-)-methyltransferase